MTLKNLTKNKQKNTNNNDKNLLFREPTFMKVIVREKSTLARPQSSGLPLQNLGFTKQNTFIPQNAQVLEEQHELVPQNTLIQETPRIRSNEKSSVKESSYFNSNNSGASANSGGGNVKEGMFDRHRIVRVCI